MKHGKTLEQILRDERDVEDMRKDDAPLFGPAGFHDNGRVVFPHVLNVAFIPFNLFEGFAVFHFRTSSMVENGNALSAEDGFRLMTLGHPRRAMSWASSVSPFRYDRMTASGWRRP